MPQESKPSIALLVSQHPAINHSVILREIHELRKSLDLRTVSIRPADRPLDQLSEEERNEAAITYYIKPQGIRGALAALTTAVFSLPVALLSGWFYALKLSGLHPNKAFRN